MSGIWDTRAHDKTGWTFKVKWGLPWHNRTLSTYVGRPGGNEVTRYLVDDRLQSSWYPAFCPGQYIFHREDDWTDRTDGKKIGGRACRGE